MQVMAPLQQHLPWTPPLSPSPDQTLPRAGDSLRVTEAYSASKSTAPRISLDMIEAYIADIRYLNLGDAIERVGGGATGPHFRVTVCILTMRNDFVVIGKSAPMDPANFDHAKGRRFAYEDAIRQLWPLMAFAALDRASPYPLLPEAPPPETCTPSAQPDAHVGEDLEDCDEVPAPEPETGD